MATTNAPTKVIRECDFILDGKLIQTPEQFQRWAVVQIKKLAQQASARHKDIAQVRNIAKAADRFAKGGL